MGAEDDRHVVVLGAGLAGLAAAWRLRAAGHAVTLVERAPRAGGRAAPSDGEGAAHDPLAAAVAPTDAALLALVREAGLLGDLLPLRPWRAAQWDGARAVPVAAPGLRGVARLPGVRRLDALRLARLPRLLRRYRPALDPERAAALDDRSLADFGALYFGRSAVSGWMEPWLAERAPVDEREASRASFLLRFARERGGLLGSLRRPTAWLAQSLAARLPARFGCAARAVVLRSGGGLAVALEDGELAAGAVVLALPAPEALRVASPILQSGELDFLSATRSDAALVWTPSANRLPVEAATRVRIPRRSGGPFSVLALDPGEEGAAPRVTAIAREPWSRAHLDAPDDALEKELAAELARFLPAATASGSRARVLRFPEAWPRFDVGRYRALARFREIQADRRRGGRRLYFAGDYLAAPTLEGAVASGLRAAADAIEDLGGRMLAS